MQRSGYEAASRAAARVAPGVRERLAITLEQYRRRRADGMNGRHEVRATATPRTTSAVKASTVQLCGATS